MFSLCVGKHNLTLGLPTIESLFFSLSPDTLRWHVIKIWMVWRVACLGYDQPGLQLFDTSDSH